MIQEAIVKLTRKEDLTRNEMQRTMAQIMKGKTTPVQISSFLTSSIIKGVTTEELIGAARVMRHFVKRVHIRKNVVIDTCGTGGDKSATCNISTVAAIIVAAAGVCVAKHGNRSVSSKCGSADVLEALGVKIELEPEKVKQCIEAVDIGFMFAPAFHPAMKYAQPIRKELGIRTIFNFLGPLTNPAFVRYQLIGVSDERLLKDFVIALKELGSKRVMTVMGEDGLDEITTTASTKICELNNGKIRTYTISPSDFGIKKVSLSDIQGKDVQTNVRITREILDGKDGPYRDVVSLNAAAALYVANAAPSIKEGLELAHITIDSGRAKEKLQHLIDFTNKK